MKQGNQKTAGWFFKTLFILAIAGTGLVTICGAAAFWYFSRDLPQLISVSDYRPLGVTRILGSGGRDDALLGEFYKERRYLVPLDKIPDTVVRAFVSAEDELFFQHQGVNLASMVRAAIANFKAGHTVQGGSTITQQVVKSLLLTPEKRMDRKVKEIILANRIEKNLTKQQILYLYLNQIYLGHGYHGIQAAARGYFRKDVSQLSVAEAAVLAGMPQAPSKYSPHLNPKRAKERQLYVLRRMYESKYITQAQMSEAAAMPVRVFQDVDVNARYSAYLVEHIRRYLVDKYGEKAVYEDGLTVAVPASPELGLAARNSLREGLRQIDRRLGYRGPLRHLKDPAEIEKFMKEQRLKLIQKKVQYEMLLPDGRLEAIEALKVAGIQSESLLLDQGESYEAIVTSVDDRKKTAGVMIGAVRADLPFETMKWAKPLKDEKNAQQLLRGEPTAPSRVLYKGDVILVRVEKIAGGQVGVSLDQVPQIQGALFSLEAQTGAVLAMEGGYDYQLSEFNRAIQAMRQPGSAFKPIIYSAAIERGFTPATIIVDSPLVYGEGDGKWKPGNFEEKFFGDTTFRAALIKSRNVPTIKIVQSLQVPFVIDYAKRLGLSGQFPMDLSISLGSAALSLVDLTKAYALFPRMGRKVAPIYISTVKDRDGHVLEENKVIPLPVAQGDMAVADTDSARAPSSPRPVVFPSYPPAEDPDQVMDPRVASVMTHILKEVVNFGTGHDAKTLGRTAAGKTGTTNDSIDAWFMGFTPTVVTGVWVGFDSQRTIGPRETGARAALPIWLSFMKEAVKGYPDADFNIPPGVIFVSIDPVSGKRAAANASNSIKEAFIEGTEPTDTASPSGASSGSQSEFLKEDIE